MNTSVFIVSLAFHHSVCTGFVPWLSYLILFRHYNLVIFIRIFVSLFILIHKDECKYTGLYIKLQGRGIGCNKLLGANLTNLTQPNNLNCGRLPETYLNVTCRYRVVGLNFPGSIISISNPLGAIQYFNKEDLSHILKYI